MWSASSSGRAGTVTNVPGSMPSSRRMRPHCPSSPPSRRSDVYDPMKRASCNARSVSAS